MDSFNLQISYPLQPIDIALQYGILSFSVNHKPNLAFSANGLMMSFIFMIKPLIHIYIKLRPATPIVNQSAMIRINFAIYHSGILNPTCHFALYPMDFHLVVNLTLLKFPYITPTPLAQQHIVDKLGL